MGWTAVVLVMKGVVREDTGIAEDGIQVRYWDFDKN